jgi:hypothetical protein
MQFESTLLRKEFDMMRFKINLLGAAASSVLAVVGLASAPAQAGTFTLTPYVLTTGAEVRDSEWGAGGPEPIWSTFPGGGQSPCLHGQATCVQGWDNATVSYSGSSGDRFLIEYFGSGTSAQTNNFLWNFESLFGASPPVNANCANSFAVPCASTTVAAVVGNLPFVFTTNLGSNLQVDNGEVPTVLGSGNVEGAHYFVTTMGLWSDPTGNAIYLGFSDGNGNQDGSDDDAADYVIRISKVPEPGTLALLGLGLAGLGLGRRRKVD